MSKPILWLLLTWLLLGTQSSYAQSNALSFDGSDDWVTSALPSVFTTMASSDITVEAWIKPQNPSSSQLQCILFAQSNSSNFLSLAIGPSGSVYAYVVSAGVTSSVSSIATLSAGQWTHLALTWQAATRTVQLYLNGTLATTTAGGSSSSAADNVLMLGARTDGAQPYNGVLDELNQPRRGQRQQPHCDPAGQLGQPDPVRLPRQRCLEWHFLQLGTRPYRYSLTGGGSFRCRYCPQWSDLPNVDYCHGNK